MLLIPLVVWASSKHPRSPGAEQPSKVSAGPFAQPSLGLLGHHNPWANDTELFVQLLETFSILEEWMDVG